MKRAQIKNIMDNSLKAQLAYHTKLDLSSKVQVFFKISYEIQNFVESLIINCRSVRVRMKALFSFLVKKKKRSSYPD